MTLDELQTQTRFKTNISNTTTLTDAQITTLLNQAYLKVFRAIVDVNEDYFEEQKTVFNLIALSSLYSLPTDHVKFKQLRLAYSTPSSEGDFIIAKSFDPTETNSVPIQEVNTPISSPIVDITNNYFRIMPKPTTGVTGGGEIYYIARPSALVNSADTPVIPSTYHDLLAIDAGARAAEKFENFRLADRLDNQFLSNIEKMKTQLAVREINRKFRFKDIRETNVSNRRELPN